MILIFGIFGGLRCNELLHLNINDVEWVETKDEKDRIIYVTVRDTKTHITKNFPISNKGCTFDAIDLCRRYQSLRPAKVSHTRYFINYRNGKCTCQPIGENTIGGVPKKVAEFLHLPNPELYTGHCIRRSSTTMLANNGATFRDIKRHGNWKSDKVASRSVSNVNLSRD